MFLVDLFVCFEVLVFVIFSLPLGGLTAVCDCGTPWTFLLTFLYLCPQQVKEAAHKGLMLPVLDNAMSNERLQNRT